MLEICRICHIGVFVCLFCIKLFVLKHHKIVNNWRIYLQILHHCINTAFKYIFVLMSFCMRMTLTMLRILRDGEQGLHKHWKIKERLEN